MESSIPARKTERLWQGRKSEPNARYFTTICLKDRSKSLLESALPSLLIHQLESQQCDGDFELRCTTVMKDHLHLIFRLGDRISIGQSIAKFKSKTRSYAIWQRDFYEHRIRNDESEEEFAFYMFMNPYVDRLCSLDEPWPNWTRWRNIPYQFEELLGDGISVPESWIKRVKGLEIGEKLG